MNANQLLDVIGDVKSEYLSAAMATKEKRPASGHVHKIALIAAIVSLMVLLLIGCAVVILSLRDMALEEIPVSRPADTAQESTAATEKVFTAISLGGYKDSKEHQATKEWYEFTQSYDPELEILFSVDEDNLGIPAEYQHIYGCYTQEMADKVDQIAAKYNLKLMGVETLVQRWQQPVLFEVLGIDGVCHVEKAEHVTDGAGYFYPNGDFQLEFEFLLPQENDNWNYAFWASFLYTRQGYFSPKYAMVDIDGYEQWMYTTADGTEVLIAKRDAGALLFAEQKDAYVTVLLNNSMMDEEGTPTKEDIQLAADIIDFTIRPQEADLTDIDARLAAAEKAYREAQEQKKAAVSSYGDLIRVNYIENAAEKIAAGTMRNYYALYDIDGNGVEELLLSREDDHFRDFYTMIDGKIQRQGIWGHYELCGKSIILQSSSSEVAGDKWYAVYEYGVEGFGLPLVQLKYIAEENAWYQIFMVDCIYMEDGTLESYRDDNRPISAEEAQAILDQYVPIDIEMKPISEYPMDD